MRPPPNVLGTLGVEEHQIKGAVRQTAEHQTRIVMDERYVRGQSGTSEVLRRQFYLVLGGLNGRHRATDHPSSVRKPKSGVAVRCADLEYPACDCRANQHGQELAGVTRNVEHT